jgi:O-antigen ligase
VAVINSLVLIQTATRGAMVGLFGGVFLIALLFAILEKENKKLKISAIVFIVAILIAGAGIFLIKDSNFVKNYSPLQRITSISINEGSAEARILNWQIALEGFKERPIFGWGQSNFNYVFDKYYLPAHHGNETWFDRTHNIVFDWLIAGGIFGLLLYFSIIISALYLIWFKKGNLILSEQVILTGLLSAYVFQNLFVFDQLTSYILFILVLGFINSQTKFLTVIYEKDLGENFRYTATTLFLILLPFTVYLLNVPSYLANKELISAFQIFVQD